MHGERKKSRCVQNNLLEYHALFDFCAPGLLGDRSVFKRGYADVIERGQVRAGPDSRGCGVCTCG